jgi:beta-N-acetylhexosaminidase
VLDVNSNPENPLIGDRAFGAAPEQVIRFAWPYAEGLRDGGVIPCGKHFPGHGDTSVDSHLDLPVVEHPPDRIRRVECVPFRKAIEADVAFIMTAHVLVPALDEEKPATLSRTIVHDLLRAELGFEGVIISDDLEMKALAKTHTVADAAVEAVAAGCDGVMICRAQTSDRGKDVEVQAAALEALVHAVEDGRIPYKRLEDALTRHRRTKERFLAAAVLAGREVAAGPAGWKFREVVGCDVHRRIAEEMARFL